MGMIPLPALNVQPPQQEPDPLSKYVQLSSLLQEQKLKTADIQNKVLENQQLVENQQRQAATSKLYKDAFASGTTPSESAVMDAAGPIYGPSLIKANQEAQKTKIDYQTSTLAHHVAVANILGWSALAIDQTAKNPDGTYDPIKMQTYLDHIPGDDPELSAMVSHLKQGIVNNPDKVPAMIQQAMASSPEVQKHLTEQTQAGARLLGARYKDLNGTLYDLQPEGGGAPVPAIPGSLDPNAWRQTVDQTVPVGAKGENQALHDRTAADVNFYVTHGDAKAAQSTIAEAGRQLGTIEKETDPRVIASHEAEALSMEKSKQLVEGIVKPAYQMTADGQFNFMSQTGAQKDPNTKAIIPVTEPELRNDIYLTNQLSDVAQKVAKYSSAMNSYKLTDAERGAIAEITGSDKFKLGAFGAEIPVDRVNSVLQNENIKELSPGALRILATHYNAAESMIEYQRILAKTARGSQQGLSLNLNMMPNSAQETQEAARQKFDQFFSNLPVMSRGLPNIPGISKPDEIIKDVYKKQGPGLEATASTPITGGLTPPSAPDKGMKWQHTAPDASGKVKWRQVPQ